MTAVLSLRVVTRRSSGYVLAAWVRRLGQLACPGRLPAALHAADSLAVLPDHPAAAAEEIQRRREEIGFSYFVFGADVADTLAPVVAELAGH